MILNYNTLNNDFVWNLESLYKVNQTLTELHFKKCQMSDHTISRINNLLKLNVIEKINLSFSNF